MTTLEEAIKLEIERRDAIKKQAAKKQPAQIATVKQSPSESVVKQSPQDGTILNPVANALGFGWSDEASAGFLTAMGILAGEIPKNQANEAFTAIKTGMENQRKSYAEEKPLTSASAEIVTAASVGLPRILQSLASSGMKGAGVVAGAEGAIYGAGENESQAVKQGEPIAFGYGEQPVSIPSRGVSAIQQSALAVPLGIGGAKAAQFGLDYIAEKAARNKLVREGIPANQTSTVALADPSQVVRPERVVTGDPVQDVLANAPKPPVGIVQNLNEAFNPLKPRVEPVLSAEKAKYQKVSDSTLTGIRETNNATRNAMKKVTDTHWNKVSNISDSDPFIFIGNEFKKRLDVIKDAHKDAIKLQGEGVKDLRKIKQANRFYPDDFTNSLDDIADSFYQKALSDRYNIKVDDETGFLDFTKAPLSMKRPENRKTLNHITEKLKEVRNGADLHLLRKDIDGILYDSKGKERDLDEKTKELLNEMRDSIRDRLIKMSDKYAKANEVISKNLDAFQNMGSVMPRLKERHYDLEDLEQVKMVTEYIGQQLRQIEGNSVKASDLSNVVDIFDDLATEYGKKFDVDIKQLNRFLGEIKLRLGTGKVSGLQSEIEGAVDRKIAIPTSAKDVKDAGYKFLNPAKEISDEKAYKSIVEYINDINKRSK